MDRFEDAESKTMNEVMVDGNSFPDVSESSMYSLFRSAVMCSSTVVEC